MASCCACPCPGADIKGGARGGQPGLPLICMVPRQNAGGSRAVSGSSPSKTRAGPSSEGKFQLLDEKYIKKHFDLPKRALYLDPFRRPLITFPMSQGQVVNFNMARKTKINQQILDGFLDPSEAISAPSVFPYAKTEAEARKESNREEELIYILQLPDWEFKCPVHNETIRTPRFIWHSCKKSADKPDDGVKRGGGPLNKPKPWLLSRHTDFDLLSQW